MPFTRITLLKGRSPEELKAISDSFHQALVETFDTPATDKFQAFHQLERGELVFDRDYFSRGRSDGFVVFQVTTGKPRSAGTKRAFYRRAVELLGQAPGIRPQDVMIIVNAAGGEDWSFSDGEAQMAPADAA